jgi:hypothetical protein
MNAKQLVCEAVSEKTLPLKPVQVSNLGLALPSRGWMKLQRRKVKAQVQVDISPVLKKMGFNLADKKFRPLQKHQFHLPVWSSEEAVFAEPITQKREAWKFAGGAAEAKRLAPMTTTELFARCAKAAEEKDAWGAILRDLGLGHRV